MAGGVTLRLTRGQIRPARGVSCLCVDPCDPRSKSEMVQLAPEPGAPGDAGPRAGLECFKTLDEVGLGPGLGGGLGRLEEMSGCLLSTQTEGRTGSWVHAQGMLGRCWGRDRMKAGDWSGPFSPNLWL